MEDRRRRKRCLSRWAVAALSVGMGSLRPHLTLSLSRGEYCHHHHYHYQ
jgi:hypothetical protein